MFLSYDIIAPLAQNFRKVLATEVSKPSVQLASRCFAANNVTNIKVARLSSEEFTDAYANNKTYHRLQEIGVKISDYDLKTVFVDPPRAGLDDGTCLLVSKFDKIVYVSCNPVTLARDLAKLVRTHRIVRYAGFDQFPYTHHLEAGVILIKRESEALTISSTSSSTSTSTSTSKSTAETGETGVTTTATAIMIEEDGSEEASCLGKRKLSDV